MPLAIFEDLKRFIEDRAPEIAHASAAVEAIDNDEAVQAIQAAIGITPEARRALAVFIGAIDGEFTRVAQEATENGRAAGMASVTHADPPPADGEPDVGEPPPDPPA